MNLMKRFWTWQILSQVNFFLQVQQFRSSFATVLSCERLKMCINIWLKNVNMQTEGNESNFNLWKLKFWYCTSQSANIWRTSWFVCTECLRPRQEVVISGNERYTFHVRKNFARNIFFFQSFFSCCEVCKHSCQQTL